MLGAWTFSNDGFPVPGGNSSRVGNAFIHANNDAAQLYHSKATMANFRFDHLPVVSLNSGQPGPRERNHFSGDIGGFHFNDFLIAGKLVTMPQEAGFHFKNNSGKNYSFK